MSETMTRTYELGYLLVPSIVEGDIAASVAALTNLVAKHDGTVLSEGTPEFIDLAYQMEKDIGGKKVKWTQGYFGWFKFEAMPEKLEAIKKALDADLSLIRYLLIKTTADNTVIFKKPKMEAKRGSAFPDDEMNEEVLEEDEEELMKDDHEKLPNVEEEVLAQVPAEGEEGETQ